MVYYGKLSKGCERCRRLKVKCDQQKPRCRRCERTKTICPGYRDLTNLVFRNDSARIVEKIRREAEREQLEPVPRESDLLAGSSRASFHVHSLRQPLGQLAASFYFTNLAVKGPPLSAPACPHDILTNAYLHDVDSAASNAIEAVGLAALSNLRRDQHLFQEARARYARALRGTNQMIGDSERICSDATATAVLLLCQFESMYLNSKENARDAYLRWSAHVAGASALLRLRGQEQFKREAGVSLFFAIRLQIVRSIPRQRDVHVR